MNTDRLRVSLKKTSRTFIRLIPIILGMLLLTSLMIRLFPKDLSANLFGHYEIVDAMIGAVIGSVAAGHPLASYLLGGEMMKSGAGLVAATALVVSWVTVGIVQIPAEALMLGTRFAIFRNLFCFFSAIGVAFATVFTLQFLD